MSTAASPITLCSTAPLLLVHSGIPMHLVHYSILDTLSTAASLTTLCTTASLTPCPLWHPCAPIRICGFSVSQSFPVCPCVSFPSLGLRFLFCKMKCWIHAQRDILLHKLPATLAFSSFLSWGHLGTASGFGWLAVSSWGGIWSPYFCRLSGRSGSVWAAIPHCPEPVLTLGHNTACLFSSRSGLDKPATFLLFSLPWVSSVPHL